jgi:hypothetical protein
MTAWLTIPSKRPTAEAERTLALWRNQGYRIAIWRDSGDAPVDCDLMIQEQYPGYARAVNELIAVVLETDPSCGWCIAAGDDTEPDPGKRADEIARECTEHFGGTFGVMQPTGDRWGEDPNLPNCHPMRTAYIDRVCGSAWLGREFCERSYCGNGPLFEGYHHMYVDEELQAIAVQLGILWQRRDLTHKHRHWARETGKRPGFLEFVNSPQHWNQSKRLFESRRDAGFPGHQPICV